MKKLFDGFNYFIFCNKFNIFDFMMLMAINVLANTYSLWLYLLVVPFTLFSGAMAHRVDVKEATR